MGIRTDHCIQYVVALEAFPSGTKVYFNALSWLHFSTPVLEVGVWYLSVIFLTLYFGVLILRMLIFTMFWVIGLLARQRWWEGKGERRRWNKTLTAHNFFWFLTRFWLLWSLMKLLERAKIQNYTSSLLTVSLVKLTWTSKILFQIIIFMGPC